MVGRITERPAVVAGSAGTTLVVVAVSATVSGAIVAGAVVVIVSVATSSPAAGDDDLVGAGAGAAATVGGAVGLGERGAGVAAAGFRVGREVEPRRGDVRLADVDADADVDVDADARGRSSRVTRVLLRWMPRRCRRSPARSATSSRDSAVG